MYSIVTHFAGSAGSLHDEKVFFLTSRPNGAFFSSKCLLATCRTCTQVVVVFVVFPSWRSRNHPVYAAVHWQMHSLGCDDCICHLFFSLLHYTESHMLSSEDLSPSLEGEGCYAKELIYIFLLKMIADNISILMYIMWVILRLFSALSRRVGALQISIIIMSEDSPHITMQCTTMFEHGHGVLPDVSALWRSPSQGVARRPQTIQPSLHASASELMSLTTMLWNQNRLLGWPSNTVNYCAHKHSQVSYVVPKLYLDSMR